MVPHRRREFLQASVMTVVLSFAGCTGLRPPSTQDRTPAETPVSRQQATATPTWPQLAHDAWHTSYNSETTGPQSDVEAAWTNSLGAQLFDPVVASTVYVTESWTDGTAYALNQLDGTVDWTNPSLPPMRWPATVYEDRTLVVTRTEENHVRLHALASGDGTQEWETTLTASSSRHPPVAPTVAGGRVFIASDTGVIALDGETGTKQWTQKLSENVVDTDGGARATIWATPTVRGKFVYTFDRNESVGTKRRVYALDLETGEQRWTKTLSVPDEFWRLNNHVIAGEQRLFVLISGSKGDGGAGGGDESPSERGAGRLFVLDPESGEVQWTHDFDGTTRVSAFTGDTLFVPVHNPASDANHVHAINLKEQRIDWTQTFDGVINAVAATDNAVYVNGDGIEAVDASDGTRLWQQLSGQSVGAPIIANDTVYATYAPEGEFRQTKIAAFHEQ